jgi:integrase
METQTEPRTNRTKGEGSIYADTKTGIWMYSVMSEGKRLTKSLGTRDEKEARKKYIPVSREFGGQIERGELEPTSVKNFTIGELLARYVAYMNENGRKSAKVVKLVIGVIERDAAFLPKRKVSVLTTTDFETYRQREVTRDVSQRTINYRFALIRAALKLEMKRTPSCVAKVPYIPMVTEDNARDGFLEYDDHESVLDALPRSLKALFVVAFHSGCRLGEVLNMRWSDVDWKNRVIRLPKTKNGSKRNLPFWGSIEEHLKTQKAYRQEHHQDCEHLFFWYAEDCGLSHGGVRVAPGAPVRDFRASWANTVKRAHEANTNVKDDLLFHDLRRSGVRVMIQDAGIPEAQAMLISGHETRTMLERYNIVSLKNVQDAGAKLDAWSRNRATSKAA